MQNNIIISEINKISTGYYLNLADLIVYTGNSGDLKEFAIGSYGEFSLNIDETSIAQTHSAKLSGYNIIDYPVHPNSK